VCFKPIMDVSSTHIHQIRQNHLTTPQAYIFFL
jgi:hypothetical protein